MSNIINVTAVDNELVITAFQFTGSYELCRIKSGNNSPVNININIYAGQYQGPLVLDGISTPLSGTYNVALAAGSYNFVGVGIDWGGPQAFAFKLNGTAVAFKSTGEVDGVVQYTKATPLTV